METLQIIGQGLVVTLLARMVWHLGHIAGTLDSVVERVGKLETWRDAGRRPASLRKDAPL